MRDRITWLVIALVLAAMAASLWSDAWVAALGAGAAAAYAAISAVRGRCFGGVCALPAASVEPAEERPEPARE